MPKRKWPKRTWKTMVAVVAAACGMVAVAPVGVTASPARTYTYVAAGFYVIGPDLAAAVVGEQSGVRTAPLGWAELVPESDRFTLRVEDRNPVHTVVAVTLASRGWYRDVCAPQGEDVVVEGVPVGQRVSLYVWEARTRHEWCPASRATTGTLTITP